MNKYEKIIRNVVNNEKHFEEAEKIRYVNREAIGKLEKQIKNNEVEKDLYEETIKYNFYMAVLLDFDRNFGSCFYSLAYEIVERKLRESQARYNEIAKKCKNGLNENDLYFNLVYMYYNNRYNSFVQLDKIAENLIYEMNIFSSPTYMITETYASNPISLLRKLNMI